jgi:uncharacterized protein YbcI
MKNLTKGQLEAKISEAVTRFKAENIGKGPKEVKSYILEDMVIVRLKGTLTTFEAQLTKKPEGSKLVKLGRIYLLEKSKDIIDSILSDTINVNVKNSFIDVNPRTGDMFIVLELSENAELKFSKRKK